MAKKVDHEQRKREIADKALRLFSQVGYENVSLLMIAAAAGISRTILYRYFCSKREVMDASIRQVTGLIEERSRQLLATKASSGEKLIGICHIVTEEMFAHREFVIAVFDFVVGMVRTGADMNVGISEYTAGTRNAIRALLAHGIRAGEFLKSLDIERSADSLYSLFESCAMRIVLNTERGPEQSKRRFTDIIRTISSAK